MTSEQYKALLLNTLSQPNYVRGIPVEGSYPEQYDTDLPVVHLTSIEDIQNIGTSYPSKCYFALVQDIDASGFDYRPVDLVQGIFDGNGYTISNLSLKQINNLEYEDIYAALFRNVAFSTIKDLTLDAFDSTALFSAGIASALQHSSVLDCTMNGKMFGIAASGIATTAYSSNLVNCLINIVDTTADSFSGVVNQASDTLIQGCSFNGEALGVTLSGILLSDLGGCRLTQCSANGQFTPYLDDTSITTGAVGILGQGIDTIVEDSYSKMLFSPGFDTTAGLVGSTSGGFLRRCYTTDPTLIADSSGTTIEYVYNTDLFSCSTFVNWDLENIWECDDGSYLELRLVTEPDIEEKVFIEINDYESFLSMDSSKSYKLMTDLNFIGVNYEPIDLTTGCLDGNGHTISNITYNDSVMDHVGVFSKAAAVLDLSCNNCSFAGRDYVGVIVGEMTIGSGTVVNCETNSCEVYGRDYVGGIAGYGGGPINCRANGNVSGRDSVGGVAGRGIMLKHCSSVGNSIGNDYVGGILGVGSAVKSSSIGDVDGNTRVGGFAGSVGIALDCFTRGSTNGVDRVGGFCGSHSGLPAAIRRCYRSGPTSGSGSHVDGFRGFRSLFGGPILDSYCNSDYATSSEEGVTNVTTAQMLCPNNFGWDYINTWECVQGNYPSIRQIPILITDTSDLPFDITMNIRVLDVEYPGYLINEWLEAREIFIYDDPGTGKMTISKHDFSSPVIGSNNSGFVPWGAQQFYTTPQVKEGWVIKNGRIVNLAGEQLIQLYAVILKLKAQEKGYIEAIEVSTGDTSALEASLVKTQDKLAYYIDEFTTIYQESSRKLPQEEKMYNNIIL
jgi:hypothetical protein